MTEMVLRQERVVAARPWRDVSRVWQARPCGEVTAMRSCCGWPYVEVAALRSWQREGVIGFESSNHERVAGLLGRWQCEEKRAWRAAWRVGRNGHVKI